MIPEQCVQFPGFCSIDAILMLGVLGTVNRVKKGIKKQSKTVKNGQKRYKKGVKNGHKQLKRVNNGQQLSTTFNTVQNSKKKNGFKR